MMRRVLEERIWVRGTYEFADRAAMYSAVGDAKRCLGAGCPLEVTYNTPGDATLSITVAVPMFDQHERTAEFFALLRQAARHARVEARVDVL